MVRYVGERYGDAEHKENVDDYFLADLKISYTMKNISIVETAKLSLELQNIFNNKYVSLINASDDSRSGSTSYYVGAPFTVVMKVVHGVLVPLGEPFAVDSRSKGRWHSCLCKAAPLGSLAGALAGAGEHVP